MKYKRAVVYVEAKTHKAVLRKLRRSKKSVSSIVREAERNFLKSPKTS